MEQRQTSRADTPSQDRDERTDSRAASCSRTNADIFLAEHAGGADLSTMVMQAWEIDALETAYRSFLDRFPSARVSEPVTGVIELVHAWRRFPLVDPALPRELLPPQWSGEAAANLFAQRHEAWGPKAQLAWSVLDEAGG